MVAQWRDKIFTENRTSTDSTFLFDFDRLD